MYENCVECFKFVTSNVITEVITIVDLFFINYTILSALNVCLFWNLRKMRWTGMYLNEYWWTAFNVWLSGNVLENYYRNFKMKVNLHRWNTIIFGIYHFVKTFGFSKWDWLSNQWIPKCLMRFLFFFWFLVWMYTYASLTTCNGLVWRCFKCWGVLS